MRILLCTTVMLGTFGVAAVCRADEKQKSQTQNQSQQAQQQQTKQPFLGVNVEAVPTAMRSHMPDMLPEGQGVLVDQVTKDSPASKAGLRAHDILLNYGDQKLSSPDQLVSLVHGSKAGQTINLSILRGGKTTTCQVTLGEGPAPDGSNQPQVYRFRPDDEFQGFFEENGAMNGEHAWKSFDAMKLTRTDENHWAAEIEYRTKDGKKETRKFSGTREEIRKSIQGDKDLPQDEQHHLLRALNFHPPVFQFYFPSFGTPQPNSQQP